MNQQYFILVLAHSLHGKLRRVQIPHRVIYVVLAFAVLGVFSLFGFITSYARMTWKVANYNSLRQEITALRARYQTLQTESKQTNDQLANLQLFASEISMAYGIKRQLEGPSDISSEGQLIPTFQQSLAEYDLLRNANLSSYSQRYARPWMIHVRPSIWPVDGRLESYFGKRSDPFSGEGAFHRGIDITAPVGTPIHAAADGIVVFAQVFSGLGRLVVIDHGNGIQTYYGHMSQFAVVAGQEIRQGEVIGRVGKSGRATGSHLHYEVRLHNNPENPVRYLSNRLARVAQSDFPF